jgi:hypothetical protein
MGLIKSAVVVTAGITVLSLLAPVLEASSESLSPSQETERRLCGNKEIKHNLIIETDFTWDIDDLGALSEAHTLADQCIWRLIAVMYNEKNGDCPPAIKAVNQWYGRDDIPIGVWGGEFNNVEDSPWCPYVRTVQEDKSKNYGLDKYPQWFSSELNAKFESAIKVRNYNSVTDYRVRYSMDVYKDVLSKVEDGSVTIVSIGYIEDLYTLIHSDNATRSLWKSKIGNMYLMGGGYNLDSPNVHGFKQDGISLYRDWTKPIITSCIGGEDYLRTGLNQTMIDEINSGHYTQFTSVNPVKRGYFYHCGMGYASKFCRTGDNPNGELKGRLSWDPFTMLLAAKDTGALSDREGIETGPNNGNFGCFPEGFNNREFLLAGITNQSYILSYMHRLINQEPLIAQHV